ncbi:MULTISPECIES: NAD(P)H-dependent oxidoreductase [unclassified Streptomyces]|uniref:FMN-dependent NADH-azoreductase n=1 Tax=unclassified Streptomyces TaxID=2593676 RepID=UPI0023652C17|nr:MULTISPECIES: NAD(P)H-dependent oxidoreductase [unclassified Streptomyces]MDF3149896.1 NAD(P)H-dependent oxidoreductase [Streptomyces sp. T21Q-yed]WDF44504.1 NAD(P)H-dependent oxidoreductase [Streptomyces sp. T12]
MTLLHIDSSADLAADSVTRQLTDLYVRTWRAVHPDGTHRHRDLSADPVPPLTPAYTTLGRRVEREGFVPPDKVPALIENAAEEREWQLTLPLLTELRSADTVLLGVPMYNFSVPASLKAWIDRVTFPGAFSDPDSGESLLHHTRVVVVMARGGGYGPGAPLEHCDFQTPYLRAYFGRLGVAPDNLHLVAAELTRIDVLPQLAGLEHLADVSLGRACAVVTELAAA